MGGFTRNPQRLLDETRGFFAPTRAAPPHTAPSPALPSSSPAQLNCIYLISAVTPPPPRHIDTIPPFSNPLSSPSLLLAVPGLHREPPAAPAATETCAPSSKARTPQLVPLGSSYFRSFSLLPPPPCGAPASKRGQPRNQRRRIHEGQLETALKRLNFFPSNLYWN